MTLSTNIAKAAAPAVGGIVFGALGAAAGAFAGGVGASILNKAGYDGYIPLEAAQMGAIGGAVYDGATGVVVGALLSCGLFSTSSDENQRESHTSRLGLGYVASTVVAGLVGYGIMNATSHETVMQLAETAASFAVGGAVTMIPATCGLVCIALPLVAAAAYFSQEEAYVPTPTEQTNASNVLSLSAV